MAAAALDQLAEVFRQNEGMYRMMLEAVERAKAVLETACHHWPSSSPTTWVGLSSILELQQSLNQQLPPLPDWGHFCPDANATALASRHLPGLHARAIAAYTALIPTAVKRMAQLTTILPTINALQLAEMLIIWDILIETGMFQAEYPHDWPGVNPATQGAMHAAVDELTAWQLEFTRGPSAAWEGMQASLPPPKLQLRMFRAVSAAMRVTHPLLRLHGNHLRTAVAQMPETFIPNLCHLACEQLGPGLCMRAARPRPIPYLRDVMYGLPYTDVFAHLVSIIFCCVLEIHPNGRQSASCPDPRFSGYLCPGLFETAKLALVACVAGFTPISFDPASAARDVAAHTHIALVAMHETLKLGRHVAGTKHGRTCRAIVSDAQAVDTLTRCSERRPTEVLAILSLWLESGDLVGMETSPSALPILMSCLVCALRHADAWVCKDLAGGASSKRHPGSQLKRHPRQHVFSHQTIDLGQARRLMVQVFLQLHHSLHSGEAVSLVQVMS